MPRHCINNNVCTRMRACCVKLLASYIASLVTVAKQSLGILNSAQCIHQLLSILIYACEASSRVSCGSDSWRLLISHNKFSSTSP